MRPTNAPLATTGMLSFTPSKLPRLMIDESNQMDGSRPMILAGNTSSLDCSLKSRRAFSR